MSTSERAANFARELTKDYTANVAAKKLNCGLRTVAALRSEDYQPAELLVSRWQIQFGEPFNAALNGENPAIAARRAQIEVLQDELAAMMAEEGA